MIGHKVRAIFKNIARAILKKYCPPCHKARGIHDFILATKSPVWIIIIFIDLLDIRNVSNFKIWGRRFWLKSLKIIWKGTLNWYDLNRSTLAELISDLFLMS